MANTEKQRRVGRTLTDLERKKIAKRNAMDDILSTSARHQAQQRNNYIHENGLDRSDAKLSRKELNRNIGAVETQNLYRGRKYGVRDYVAEKAAKDTKARKEAEYQMRYAEYQQTNDRMKDLKKGQEAINKTGELDKKKKLIRQRLEKW